jgi:MFS family permease
MGQHFERRHFGAIFGLMIGIITAGGLVGPLVAGWIYDNRADYDLTWIIMAVLVLLGLLFLASTPSPDSRRSNT